jgi:translocation and assembly module TamA
LLLLWAACSAGCASIPSGQFGVTEVGFMGANEVNSDAIEACLVTREREAVIMRLGIGGASCGQPPFDSAPPKIVLWTVPWSDWPTFDPAIFEVDKRRIERWYRARGYYDAKVIGLRTYVDGHFIAEPADCDQSKSSCKIQVMVQVEEGEPVFIASTTLESKANLPPELLEKLTEELTVKQGRRFDEFDYEADKKALEMMLWNASYARATVSGRVSVDRDARTAQVTYQLDPGPSCVFGTTVVAGAQDVPPLLIEQAADIPEGKPYSYERVIDGELAVFALGAFSSVQIKPQGDGKVVDVIVDVRIGRLERWSAGIGVMSGTLQRSRAGNPDSVPQWDVHLSGSYEDRNFLGGLRQLRIEERPRLIQLERFPVTTTPYLGNLISIKFQQPATFERRTNLFAENSWDFGPDPYEGYFRHDITNKLGLERGFWRRRIHISSAIAHDIFEITDSEVPENVSSYKLPYLEQEFIIDLRNDAQRPKKGLYFSLVLQEALRLGTYGYWDFFRIVPDIRGYVPLMWDFVLAARFSVGGLFIGKETGPDLDEVSKLRGPSPYRLRGGGANSNRGFAAAKLGVGRDGGIRRYEGSVELRIPFGEDVGAVLFGDVGNVSATKSFEWERLHAAVGFGLRYYTILGAIRFDAGWRIPGLQVIGAAADDREKPVKVKVLPSAAHLTIGEAF